MLNQVMIVGRLVDDIKIESSDNGEEKAIMTLAVNRTFKNADGIYETDFVDCLLWAGIKTNVCEYCQKGDLIGVRGRLQTNNYETEDGTNKKQLIVVAEKVTFLSSKKNTEES